jgi:hypothetical protein
MLAERCGARREMRLDPARTRAGHFTMSDDPRDLDAADQRRACGLENVRALRGFSLAYLDALESFCDSRSEARRIEKGVALIEPPPSSKAAGIHRRFGLSVP